MSTIYNLPQNKKQIHIFLFHVSVFSYKACDFFIHGTEIEPTTPDLHREVLTTGLPGNSLAVYF